MGYIAWYHMNRINPRVQRMRICMANWGRRSFKAELRPAKEHSCFNGLASRDFQSQEIQFRATEKKAILKCLFYETNFLGQLVKFCLKHVYISRKILA